jgi:ferredoxin-NADP reductase
LSSGIKVTEPVGTQPAPTGGWRRATIREVAHPTAHAVRLRLEVPDRVDHLPGQHYVIRLTAPDGYVAQRSYSVASAPSDALIELFVERLDEGEVSTYLADIATAGDVLDVRGPIGGWFVWRGDVPAVGLGGGSGVVPLVAMLRHAQHLGRADLLRLAVSSRTLAELAYADELAAHGAVIALTREDEAGGRPRGRLSAADVAPLLERGDAACFVCGSAGFAEAASDLLVDAGVATEKIRVERFGPSG